MVRDINAYCVGHRDTPFCNAPSPTADAFSEDVRSYDITSFGVLHEIWYAPDSNISMGVHIYDLGVWSFR